MKEYVCEFCDKKFAKPSNVTKHQRSAQFCIKIQQERAAHESQLTCEHCGKVLSRADSLHRHYLTCIDYLIYQRTQVYRIEIEQLKDRLLEKDRQLAERDRRLAELTNTALSRTTNSYTHIDTVYVGSTETVGQRESAKYPLVASPDISELVDKLHEKIMSSFPTVTGQSIVPMPMLTQ